MIQMGYAQNAYRTTEISDSSPLDLIIKLYDGTIGFLTKAEQAIKNDDRQQKIVYLNKSRAIVEELLSSLDTNIGGDVAQNLQELYSYILIELTKANAGDDVRRIDHIRNLLKTLKSAWIEAGRTMPTSQLPSQHGMGKAPVNNIMYTT